MNLPLYIAKRYLVSKKSHNAINIISFISVASIAIGTAALVIVLSAMNGMTDLVQTLYNSFDSDIRITAKVGKTFDLTDPNVQSVKQIPGVAFFCETLEENVLLKFGDQQCIATIKGVTKDFKTMNRFDTLVHEGQYDLGNSEMVNAVMGKGVSFTLNAGVNSFTTPLTIYAPKRGISKSINPEDAFNEKKAYVSGIFSINDDFDFKYVLLPLDFTRKLLEYTNEVSAVELGIAPGANMEEVQKKVAEKLGDTYVVKNRYQQNEVLYKTLESEKLWTFMILVFILVIATFNVIGSLTMLIIEKKKDIGILWNMGAGVDLVRKIFLTEGMLITFIGAGAGLVVGVIICWIQSTFKLVTFGENYVVDAYPVHVLVRDLGLIVLVVLLIGLFAAWYPVKAFTAKYLSGKIHV